MIGASAASELRRGLNPAAAQPETDYTRFDRGAVRVVIKMLAADSALFAPREVTLLRCISSSASTSDALCIIGRQWCYTIEVHRKLLMAMDRSLSEHPVQDELSELINLLIQTSESVRHVWALG